MNQSQRHWDRIYATKLPTEVSWYQSTPSLSLEFLDALGVQPSDSVVDIGGGASSLVDRLLDRGHADVTVLDVSSHALDVTKERLGLRAQHVSWLVEDVHVWRPTRRYDVWHDRAVFHFLIDREDRARYLAALRDGLAPGGAVVIATFAQDGPERCSGLPVMRYSAGELNEMLGHGFDLVEARREEHRTPAGVTQPFTWLALRATA